MPAKASSNLTNQRSESENKYQNSEVGIGGYQAAASEDVEDSVFAVAVICRVCRLVKVLWLFVVTCYCSSINLLTRDNRNNKRKAHTFYVEQTIYLHCHPLTEPETTLPGTHRNTQPSSPPMFQGRLRQQRKRN
jgi:hypothetical protein